MEQTKAPIVDLYCKGSFVPDPLVYFNPEKHSLSDYDVNGMTFSDFVNLLEKVTECRCKVIYYCPNEVRLSEGIEALQNACDYSAFLELANERPVNVYIDHEDSDVLKWMEMEESNPEEDTVVEDVDEDPILPAREECEHEEDEQVIPIRRNSDDHFLNILCPKAGDSDNAGNVPAPAYPRHDDTQAWDEMKPELGMKFTSPDELKELLTNYAVAGGFELYYEKNDKGRLLVKCGKGKVPQCPFRMWASWMKDEDTFQIKSLDIIHNCSRAFKLGSILTYKWIGKQFLTEFLESTKLSLRYIKSQCSKKYNINVSLGQCRNAKKFALTEIEGNLKDHYEKLWDYGAEIRRANPLSHVEVFVQPQNDSTVVFERFYVSFKGVVDGWLDGCRKVIGLDGCFLKGICKGQLLSAVGRDGNNHLYPIAWAVVDVESKTTWKWFIDNLMEEIDGGGNGNEITILSDGHKGLIEAVKERCPEVEHRLCARHILANFNKRFKGECYIKPFWKAVKATTEQQFKVAMEVIRAYDVRAYNYLIERDPNCWARAFFKLGTNCDAVENGISESFNAAIEEARRKPVITMLDDIRVWAMERLYVKKQEGLGWDTVICPAIKRKIEDMKNWQRNWNAYVSGYKECEVIKGNEKYAVNVETRECGCRGWQLSGIPCVHAVAAISHFNLKAEDYVAECFTRSAFLNTYEYTIHPLNDCSMWPKTGLNQILPPIKRRLPSRPCVKRKRDQAENELSGNRRVAKKGLSQCCTICKQSGHNKTKCPMRPPSSTKKECPKKDVAVKKEAVKKKKKDVGVHLNHADAAVKKEVVKKKKKDVVRVRKASERINKIKLNQPWIGKGISEENPFDLE